MKLKKPNKFQLIFYFCKELNNDVIITIAPEDWKGFPETEVVLDRIPDEWVIIASITLDDLDNFKYYGTSAIVTYLYDVKVDTDNKKLYFKLLKKETKEEEISKFFEKLKTVSHISIL